MPLPTKAEIKELERAAEDLTDSVKDMMGTTLSTSHRLQHTDILAFDSASTIAFKATLSREKPRQA
jgi:hypothetical protein